jgi:hypothetical protein
MLRRVPSVIAHHFRTNWAHKRPRFQGEKSLGPPPRRSRHSHASVRWAVAHSIGRCLAPPDRGRYLGAAGARGLPHAQYLTALVTLHEAARRRADAGDGPMEEILSELGLQTVSI